MCIVQQLSSLLPSQYTAEPRVHLGSFYEIDVCAYEEDEPRQAWPGPPPSDQRGTTATAAPPSPTLVIDSNQKQQYAYEVLVYDQSRARQLVAAIELSARQIRIDRRTGEPSSRNVPRCCNRESVCR